MKKMKYLIIIFSMIILLFLIPSISNAETGITVTRNVYSNNGSMKFTFTGLTLDTNHEYEFGLTKTSEAQVETWHSIISEDVTATTLTANLRANDDDIRAIINSTDKGYIRIKDKTSSTQVLSVAHEVDLKIPYLLVTNYKVIKNGKTFGSGQTDGIEVALRNSGNSNAKYQYEKITDENLINKYKEIKAKNGDYLELQSILKTTMPTEWTTWEYWNGSTADGYGYTQRNIEVPDKGLYYMWLYFAGKTDSVKDIYGVILVDNLESSIALEAISLPKTENVELGKTITLTPTFNPTTATNKIVTWSSSDETVATIDNGGKITAKKLGSTIITVASQDGTKKATCTVTVVPVSSGNGSTGPKGDGTTSNSKLPKTGESITISAVLIVLAGLGTVLYLKNRQYKEIK